MDYFEYGKIFYETIKKAQETLAEWNKPDNKVTEHETLGKLLEILDTQTLTTMMEDFEMLSFPFEKFWEESGNIARTKYYPTEKTLEVEFKNRTIYQYLEVPFRLFKDLVKAPSIGSFLNRQVKGCYQYIKESNNIKK